MFIFCESMLSISLSLDPGKASALYKKIYISFGGKEIEFPVGRIYVMHLS